MNVGIVGIQGFGATYLTAFATRPNDRVIALCDLDTVKVAAMADAHNVPHRFTDFEQLLRLPDLDAVFIATPHYLHHPMVMAAMGAGKHVFCEKPLAITSEHADEMAHFARQRGLTLACHYNQRTRPYVVALRQIIRSGQIGKPYQINARWMARWTEFMFDARTSWRLQMAKSGGGIFIGRGSHLIDAALYMLDFPKVRTISATLHRHLTGGEVDDFASAILRLEGGATVNIQCSYVAHTPVYADRMEYEIFGTKGGACYLPDTAGKSRVTVGRAAMSDGAWEDLSHTIDASQVESASRTTVIADFLDAIALNRQPLVTAQQAAYITKIIEAGYRSDALGREVGIEWVR